MLTHTFRAMNTDILLAGEGTPDALEAGFQQAQKFIADSEKRFTRFTNDSELAQLNRSAGGWFEASQDMYEVIALAQQLYRQTGGLFDPAILEALELAGYDRSMDEIRLYGAGTVATLARPRLYYFSDVRLDAQNRRIALPAEMRIDLGGIAKSWIAEKAARLLSAWTDAGAVDAGGDIFFVGSPREEKSWRVTLEDPLDPEQGLAVLKVPQGAVVTSSVMRRRWMQGGKAMHHLIDPRTGQPAETEWLSVTVTGPHAAEAEVYAKSLLIGGPGEASRILGQAQGYEYIAIDSYKRLWGSNHSRELFDVTQ